MYLSPGPKYVFMTPMYHLVLPSSPCLGLFLINEPRIFPGKRNPPIAVSRNRTQVRPSSFRVREHTHGGLLSELDTPLSNFVH